MNVRRFAIAGTVAAFAGIGTVTGVAAASGGSHYPGITVEHRTESHGHWSKDSAELTARTATATNVRADAARLEKAAKATVTVAASRFGVIKAADTTSESTTTTTVAGVTGTSGSGSTTTTQAYDGPYTVSATAGCSAGTITVVLSIDDSRYTDPDTIDPGAVGQVVADSDNSGIGPATFGQPDEGTGPDYTWTATIDWDVFEGQSLQPAAGTPLTLNLNAGNDADYIGGQVGTVTSC